MPDDAAPPYGRDDGPAISPDPAADSGTARSHDAESDLPWVVIAVGAGLFAWAFALSAFVAYVAAQLVAALILLALALAAAMGAMAASAHGAHHHGHGGWHAGHAGQSGCAACPGTMGGLGTGGLLLGKGLVGIGLLYAVVQASGLLVLPFLALLLALLACDPRCMGCGGPVGAGGGGGGPCCCCCDGCCTTGAGAGATCCDCGDCCGCGGGCCDCGCGGCDCGGCDCGGCGGCGCATLAGATGAAATLARHVPDAAPGLLVDAGWRARWKAFSQRRLAHHPDLPDYEADCYRILGGRVCVGCATTYPVFLAASAALVPLQAALPGAAWAGIGAAAASAQLVSTAGLARRRWMKASVKTLLGVGLAMLVLAVRASPWPAWAQVLALGAVLALSLLSAVPRALRMRAAARERHALARGACACRATAPTAADAR